MADTVTNLTVYNAARRIVTRHMSRSDGTGESAVVKVDKSTLIGPNGAEPSFFMIERIDYIVQGMEVLIDIDATTDVNLFRLQGEGSLDFRDVGGISTKATGDTGDIRFTTNAHSAGDLYDITLYLRKHD